MIVREALKKYSKIEIELLLAHVLHKTKEFVFLNIDHRLNARQMARISRMAKRRMAGEPVAYILGYKDFMGFRFKVNRNVLIPRPESEWLVENSVRACREHFSTPPINRGRSKNIKVLDLGTGSGNIIISLAKTLTSSPLPVGEGARRAGEGYEFYATDVSKKALALAKQNAKLHKVRIKFIHSDILQNVGMSFDIIIANLPYVPKKIYDLRFNNLKFEPKNALTDNTNKFEIYHKFFRQVKNYINEQGSIYLEIDPRAKMAITNWTKKYLPGSKVKFYKDFNNLWRYAEIKV